MDGIPPERRLSYLLCRSRTFCWKLSAKRFWTRRGASGTSARPGLVPELLALEWLPPIISRANMKHRLTLGSLTMAKPLSSNSATSSLSIGTEPRMPPRRLSAVSHHSRFRHQTAQFDPVGTFNCGGQAMAEVGRYRTDGFGHPMG